MMSVLKRGNSKYWYIQFQINGKTFIRSSKTTDKRIAERMEREWRVQIHAQEMLGDKETIKFRDILDLYAHSKSGLRSLRTLKSDKQLICRYFPVDKCLHEITTHDIDRFVQTRLKEGKAYSTIRLSIHVIRATWKYGKKLGYKTSDIEFPSLPVTKHRLRYLSLEEERRLLRELDPRRDIDFYPQYSERSESAKQQMWDNYDLVVLLLDTGARYSEIAKIEWTSINLKERTIRLWRSKVSNESVLYMSDRVYQVLCRRHNSRSSDFVFTNKNGGPRNHATIAIRKAFKRCGFTDVTVHTLRHTFASRLIQNGMSVYEVKEMLGHTDIKTTLRYAHLENSKVSSKARDIINTINQDRGRPVLRAV